MIDLNSLAPDFQFLEKKGFIHILDEYKSHEFGDAFLILRGPFFSIKVERDRSQIYFDLGANFNDWYKLEYVIEFIDRSITQKQLEEPPSPSILAEHFERLFDKVTSLFKDEFQILALRQFSLQKSKLLISTLFGKARLG
jgi:hypothetical protein